MISPSMCLLINIQPSDISQSSEELSKKKIGSNFNTANLCKHFPMAIKVHILLNQISLH